MKVFFKNSKNIKNIIIGMSFLWFTISISIIAIFGIKINKLEESENAIRIEIYDETTSKDNLTPLVKTTEVTSKAWLGSYLDSSSLWKIETSGVIGNRFLESITHVETNLTITNDSINWTKFIKINSDSNTTQCGEQYGCTSGIDDLPIKTSVIDYTFTLTPLT